MPGNAIARRRWRTPRLMAGLGLVGLGAVAAPTPVPLGLALLGAGIAVLVVESRVARRLLYGLRARHPGLSVRLRHAGRRLPARMRRILERTDPWRGQAP